MLALPAAPAPAPTTFQQHQTGSPDGIVLHQPQPLRLQPEAAGRLHQLRQPLCGEHHAEAPAPPQQPTGGPAHILQCTRYLRPGGATCLLRGDTPRLRREVGGIGYHQIEPARRGQVLPPPQVSLLAQQPLLPAAALGGAPGQTAGVLPQLQPGDGEGRLPCQQQRPQQTRPGPQITDLLPTPQDGEAPQQKGIRGGAEQTVIPVKALIAPQPVPVLHVYPSFSLGRDTYDILHHPQNGSRYPAGIIDSIVPRGAPPAQDGKKTPEQMLRCFSSLLCNYSAGLIAPLGQVSLQVPQSRQELASIT